MFVEINKHTMTNIPGIKKSTSYIVEDTGRQDCDENRDDDDDFQSYNDTATTVSYRKPGKHQKRPEEVKVIPANVLRKGITESVCNLQLDSLKILKDSTRKLLFLLEEIQSKTHSKQITQVPSDTPKLLNLVKPIPLASALPSVTDILGAQSLKQLETQTNELDGIFIQDEDNDCAIYKRLTRKCICLNRSEYNDFIIHFNEETKFFTNTIGEIIKNMRIVKKFLYMSGIYTKRALEFLNEGFSQSTYTEKVEMIQGCAYADICNLFDEFSIAIILISWPCKYQNCGDAKTQKLTTNFLHKLVQLEEGRRYLNLSTKITNDIRKIIKKRAAKLEYETLETLNIVLNTLQPPLYQNVNNATYYSKPIVEDNLGSRTINVLGHHRKSMTLDEVFTHLEILNNYSTREKGKVELTNYLPVLMALFKNMLVEYNNSAMNIVITNILNNIVSKNMVKDKDLDMPKTVVIADTATETIKMKSEGNQMPPIKKPQNKKNNKNKSKIGLGASPNKFRMPSSRNFSSWEPSNVHTLNQSKKSINRHLRNSVIVVPVEE